MAAFLLSWFAAANATILCESEEHISVENIYSDYCTIDLNQDYFSFDHSDLSSDCRDTLIQMDKMNTVGRLNFKFIDLESSIKTDWGYQLVALDQNYISYILNKERIF